MNVIECLEERGLIDAVTTPELKDFANIPMKLYCGFDPTADSLHLGNLVGIIILRWFQKFDHTPFVILGGATGRIGDPSGKSAERPLLDDTTLTLNVRRIRSHFEQVLDFFHPSAKPVILNNIDWFSKMSLLDFLRDVGKHFRVNNMMAKEMVRSRLESEEGISYTEFSYQMLQAYDFYNLFTHHKVTLEIGGSDQWGNITAGIELVRKLTGKSVYGLTFPLLTRSDGKKFGKTEGGAVWLAPDRFSPYELYQYIYRIPDADVIKLMRMLTFMDLEEIRRYEQDMKKDGYAPNTAQKKLAQELTTLIHGSEGLEKALKATEAGQSDRLDAAALQEAMKDMPNVSLPLADVIDQKFVDVAARVGLFSSKSEAVRFIQGGGAYLNNEKVDDPQLRLTADHLIGGQFLLLSVGKKKKILLHLIS
jgi:tyrosyl-tRNA synthetase